MIAASELMKELSENLGSPSFGEIVSVFGKCRPEIVKPVAAALRFLELREAHKKLEALIADTTNAERDFQAHLEANPWIFGSEYSELLKEKDWTLGKRLDFMLRRVVDGYLEIVEIKKPFDDDLFLYDQSHGSYYLSSKLSPVIGQVVDYIWGFAIFQVNPN